MSAVSLFFPQETLPRGMTKWLSQWLPQSLFTCLTCPPTSVLEKFTRLHFFCSLERQHGAELKAQPWEAQWTNVHYRPYNDHQQNLGQVPWPLYVSVCSCMTLAWWWWWWQRWEGKHLPPRILAGIQWWKACKALRTLRRTCVIGGAVIINTVDFSMPVADKALLQDLQLDWADFKAQDRDEMKHMVWFHKDECGPWSLNRSWVKAWLHYLPAERH